MPVNDKLPSPSEFLEEDIIAPEPSASIDGKEREVFPISDKADTWARPVWQTLGVDLDVFVQIIDSGKYPIDEDAFTTKVAPDAAVPGVDMELVRKTMKERSDTNDTSRQAAMRRYCTLHTASNRLERRLQRAKDDELPNPIEPIESIAGLLLLHAEVIAFAQISGFKKLLFEATNNLRELLVAKGKQPLWFGDVMNLMWFCYSEPVPDAVRQMVVRYVAGHLEYYWPERRFRSLVCLIEEFERSLEKAVQDRLAKIGDSMEAHMRRLDIGSDW